MLTELYRGVPRVSTTVSSTPVYFKNGRQANLKASQWSKSYRVPFKKEGYENPSLGGGEDNDHPIINSSRFSEIVKDDKIEKQMKTFAWLHVNASNSEGQVKKKCLLEGLLANSAGLFTEPHPQSSTVEPTCKALVIGGSPLPPN
ncbi:unnamed protein product [Prunus armeniaca]|uniref:Uncharacterized protein n=1 Tax=Prunus armeniaca TaxID=36596 RepID=A0A6J5XCI1_PRUAR|nr:unnamed protein product [Prunus armeniaca]CAB4308538.1 unnamed protein product [Prunus armeniaca]